MINTETDKLMISKGYRSVFELVTKHQVGLHDTIWTMWVSLDKGKCVLVTDKGDGEPIFHDVIETTPEKI